MLKNFDFKVQIHKSPVIKAFETGHLMIFHVIRWPFGITWHKDSESSLS